MRMRMILIKKNEIKNTQTKKKNLMMCDCTRSKEQLNYMGGKKLGSVSCVKMSQVLKSMNTPTK